MKEHHAFLFVLSRCDRYFLVQNQILEFLRIQSEINIKIISDFFIKTDQALFDEVCSRPEYHRLCQVKESFHYSVYGEPNYPKEFYGLIDPPLIFSYVGEPCWVGTQKLTVVGSRSPTEKSLHWLSLELSKIVKESDWITVSGGAIGVDQWVHQLSIFSKKKTIAILPSGLNAMYPSTMKKLSLEIINWGGCVMSEFYPFEEVRKYHFKFRNRLIAALNQKCLVIEAKEKSGSLITGHFAIEMGKELYVLPGHPLDLNFKGSNELIKYGAMIFTSHQDFYDL